jgi:hypothetical protein
MEDRQPDPEQIAINIAFTKINVGLLKAHIFRICRDWLVRLPV